MSDQSRIVVSHIAHSKTNPPSCHLICGKWPEKINWQMGWFPRFEPAGIVIPMENHRHPIVNRLHELVGIGGNDGVRLKRFVIGLARPSVPQSRERNRRPILQADGIGLLWEACKTEAPSI